MKAILIIPAYNEEGSIVTVVNDAIIHGFDYVVIDDGSKDNTLQICKDNNINVLSLTRNLGIGGAVQAGHKYAYEHGYDVDIQIDGDGQHDISYVPLLLEQIKEGNDLVIGSRFLEKTDGFQSTFLRRVGINWFTNILTMLYHVKVTDPTSGFRASGRKAMALFCKSYPVDYPEPESIAEALNGDLKVKEVSVLMKERESGKSSIGGLSSIYYMIKVTLAILIVRFSKKY